MLWRFATDTKKPPCGGWGYFVNKAALSGFGVIGEYG